MIYRNLSAGRFRRFPIRYRHSDAQLGCNGLKIPDELLRERLQGILQECYGELDRENAADPEFFSALAPRPGCGLTAMGRTMKAVTRPLAIGPLAAVAGAVAERIVTGLHSCCRELYCENGGDIAVRTLLPLTVSVFPAGPPLAKAIRLKLPPGQWGIASSSGEFGHSYSRGQAQLVSIVAADAPLADAAATAVANRVLPGCDLQELVERPIDGVSAILVIAADTVFYRGDFELDFT